VLTPGSYVIDLDAVTRNARRISDEARRLDMEVLAMTKQVGRGAPFADALRAGGVNRAVAVDLARATAADAAGLHVGHLGHLVQIPRSQAAFAASLDPDNWTVFNDTKPPRPPQHPPRPAAPRTCSRASSDRTTRSTADTRAASPQRRRSRSVNASTGCTEPGSRASPPSQHCCTTTIGITSL
jgi:hypothetical protein